MPLGHVEFPAHLARMDDRNAHQDFAFDFGPFYLIDFIDQLIFHGKHFGIGILVQELTPQARISASQCGYPPWMGMTWGIGRVKRKRGSIILFSIFGLMYSGQPAGDIATQHLFSWLFLEFLFPINCVLDLTRQAGQTCSAPDRVIQFLLCHIRGEGNPV